MNLCDIKTVKQVIPINGNDNNVLWNCPSSKFLISCFAVGNFLPFAKSSCAILFCFTFILHKKTNTKQRRIVSIPYNKMSNELSPSTRIYASKIGSYCSPGKTSPNVLNFCKRYKPPENPPGMPSKSGKIIYTTYPIWKISNMIPRRICPRLRLPKPIMKKDTLVFQSPLRNVLIVSTTSNAKPLKNPAMPFQAPFPILIAVVGIAHKNLQILYKSFCTKFNVEYSAVVSFFIIRPSLPDLLLYVRQLRVLSKPFIFKNHPEKFSGWSK